MARTHTSCPAGRRGRPKSVSRSKVFTLEGRWIGVRHVLKAARDPSTGTCDRSPISHCCGGCAQPDPDFVLLPDRWASIVGLLEIHGWRLLYGLRHLI